MGNKLEPCPYHIHDVTKMVDVEVLNIISKTLDEQGYLLDGKNLKVSKAILKALTHTKGVNIEEVKREAKAFIFARQRNRYTWLVVRELLDHLTTNGYKIVKVGNDND